MNGVEAYNNLFDRKCKTMIKDVDPKYMMNGFYNSIIVSKAYSTAHTYLSNVTNFIKTIDDPKNITIDDYYAYMASVRQKSSAAQITTYHALQRYSAYLKTRNICEDYMQYVERPKKIETQETKDKRENGYLNKVEIFKMLQNVYKCRNYGNNRCWVVRDRTILMIFLSSGIRCSALYKLDVDDIDFANNTIRVFEKGYKPRRITIPQETMDVIKEWMQYREDLVSPEEKALIISMKRNRMQNTSIYNLIRDIGKAITGKHITPHKLRATYGTQLYNATKDLYFVQECMGHAHPATTELYIRGQKKDASQKAADLMSKLLR